MRGAGKNREPISQAQGHLTLNWSGFLQSLLIFAKRCTQDLLLPWTKNSKTPPRRSRSRPTSTVTIHRSPLFMASTLTIGALASHDARLPFATQPLRPARPHLSLVSQGCHRQRRLHRYPSPLHVRFLLLPVLRPHRYVLLLPALWTAYVSVAACDANSGITQLTESPSSHVSASIPLLHHYLWLLFSNLDVATVTWFSDWVLFTWFSFFAFSVVGERVIGAYDGGHQDEGNQTWWWWVSVMPLMMTMP